MNRIILAGLLFVMVLSACNKPSSPGLDNNNPTYALTVSNIYGIYTYPTVATSVSGGGSITITLNIPQGTGRTIKEITRVALGTSGANYVVAQRTTGLYNTAPIAGS